MWMAPEMQCIDEEQVARQVHQANRVNGHGGHSDDEQDKEGDCSGDDVLGQITKAFAIDEEDEDEDESNSIFYSRSTKKQEAPIRPSFQHSQQLL